MQCAAAAAIFQSAPPSDIKGFSGQLTRVASVDTAG